MKKSEIKTINIAAILAIFIFSGAGSFMNAAVQTMMDAWPQYSATTIRLVTSLPSLVSIPVTILIGGIAGRKLSYRFCAIFGTALIAAAGAAPYFFHSIWILVLVFRALVGVGVGFVAMRNSLILKSVPDDKQATVIGLGAALMNLGSMFAGPIVGVLVAGGWQNSFLYDFLALIPLALMLFFLKEPANEEETAANAEKDLNAAAAAQTEASDAPAKESKRSGFTPRTIYYIVIQFLMTCALYPLLSGMSTYMVYRGLGTAVTAGFSNSTYNLFGVLICALISPVEKKLGHRFLGVMSLIFAGAMSLIVIAPNLLILLIGSAICGVAFNSMMSIFQLYNGKEAPAAIAPLASTILIASLSLGNFSSVFYINLCEKLLHTGCDIKSAYIGAAVCYLIFGVTALIFQVAPDEYYTPKK